MGRRLDVPRPSAPTSVGYWESGSPTADPSSRLSSTRRRPTSTARRSTTGKTCSAAILRHGVTWAGRPLRPRRRPGQGRQKIGTTISSVLHPAAACHSSAHPDRSDRAAEATRSGSGLGPAIRPGGRWRHGVASLSRPDLAASAHSTRRSPPARRCRTTSSAKAKAVAGGLNLGPVGGRIVNRLSSACCAPTHSYLPRSALQPSWRTDLVLGPDPDPKITAIQLHPRSFPLLRGVYALDPSVRRLRSKAAPAWPRPAPATSRSGRGEAEAGESRSR